VLVPPRDLGRRARSPRLRVRRGIDGGEDRQATRTRAPHPGRGSERRCSPDCRPSLPAGPDWEPEGVLESAGPLHEVWREVPANPPPGEMPRVRGQTNNDSPRVVSEEVHGYI